MEFEFDFSIEPARLRDMKLMKRSRLRGLVGESVPVPPFSATGLNAGRPERVESRDHLEDKATKAVADIGASAEEDDDAPNSSAVGESAGKVYDLVRVCWRTVCVDGAVETGETVRIGDAGVVAKSANVLNCGEE